MNEWTVVTVIVAIVGLFFTVGKPITNLKGNIVKLNCTVEALSAKQRAQEKSMHKQAALNRESHMRRWDHNNEQDKKLSNHEQRLDRLEEKQMNEEQSRHHNVAPALHSLSKKPRRVPARRRENNTIHFFRRHVRRKKYFTACKRASCAPPAHSECAAAGCSPFVKEVFDFFDKLRSPSCGMQLGDFCF